MECLLRKSCLCRLQFISICFAISFALMATAADPTEVDNLKPLKGRVLTQAEQESLAVEQEPEALEVNIKRLVDRKNIIAKDRVPKNRKAETEQPPKVVEVNDGNYVLRDINDSYIYIKIESFGDVRPSEASIKNVVLTLDNKPIFTDGNSVGDGGQAFKYPWGVFSNGTRFMKMYGYQRGSHADVYGDREGLWARFKIKDFLTKSVIQNMPNKVQLSVDFRFGRGNRDPRKRYEMLLGIGQGADNGYENFDVLAKKIAASSATVPGNKDWETYEMGFLLHYKPAEVDDLKPLKERVLTQAEQEALTPKQVLVMLQEGNQRFVDGTLTLRDHSQQVRKAALGQFPKAIVLSCVDSRVPVEDVFDRGIGDVFVSRNAGNFVNVDVLGGMEFACKVAGAKLIVVMGHDDCGAVKGAIDNVKLGNLTAMLENIRPSVAEVAAVEGAGTSSDAQFVHLVTKQNVRDAIANIRKQSSVLSALEKAGKLAIVGGVYNMGTGKVEFFKGL